MGDSVVYDYLAGSVLEHGDGGSKLRLATSGGLAAELRYTDTGGRGTHAVMELSLAGLAPTSSEAA